MSNSEQGIMMLNWSKTFQSFWSHSSVLALEKQPKNLDFQSVFTPLVATFNETCAPTSWKYVAQQGIGMPTWSKIFQTFWLHSSVFALEKQSTSLNFPSVFTSNRPFGGYFQWNACTYFQKICSWTRYSEAKLIKKFPNFLVALLRFSFTKKQPENLNFQSAFTSNRPFGGYFEWNACTHFQKIWSCPRHEHSKINRKI